MSVEQLFQYVAIAGILQSIVLVMLLASRKVNHAANLFLAVLVVVSSVQALLNAFDNREFFLAYPHLSKVSWLLPSLFGPLIYLFTVHITAEEKRKFVKDLPHFIPFIIYLAVLFPYYMQSADAKIVYLTDFEEASKDDFGILTQLTIPLTFAYLVATWLYLKNYERKIFGAFSQVEKMKLQWLRQFVVIVLLILMLTAVAFYAEKFHVPYVSYIYNYTYFTVVLFIYWIGYKTLSQPAIFSGKEMADEKIAGQSEADETSNQPEPAELPAIKYQKIKLSEEQRRHTLDQLLQFMSARKAYLQPELSILDLAGQTGIPRHIISLVINDELGVNFYDFVNGYRIEEFKKNVVNPEFSHLNILAVALESGFNSKATFNSAFKKLTGQTPSHYVKSLQEVV